MSARSDKARSAPPRPPASVGAAADGPSADNRTASAAPADLAVARAARRLARGAGAASGARRLAEPAPGAASVEERVIIEAGNLDQHDLSAFKIYPMVLGWVDERIRGHGWDERRAQCRASSFPGKSRDAAPGRRGAGRRCRWAHPCRRTLSLRSPPMPHEQRRRVRAQRQHDAGVFVGREHADPLTHDPVFDLSRRLTAPDGSFGGASFCPPTRVIFRTFTAGFRTKRITSPACLRVDGSVLAGFPDRRDAAQRRPRQPVYAGDRGDR